MKAIVVTDEAAGTAGMTLVERPEPEPAINDVAVQVRASGFVATEFVRMLAKSRSDIELEPVGPLALKGLDEPVDAYRVLWAPVNVSEERAALPARLVSALSAT